MPEILVVLATLTLIGYLYYQLIETQILGFIHDDGVYAIAGKALAQGKGFTLLHLVSHPAQVKYPVLYPLVLALVWRIWPVFPDNLMALSLVGAVCTLAMLGLLYYYFRTFKRLSFLFSWLLMVLVGLNYFQSYFASALMAEGLYLILSVATVFLAEKTLASPADSTENKAPAWRSIALLVVMSALCFHARLLGGALVLAIGCYLLLRKFWKQAFVYGAATAVLTILPWVWWTKSQFPKTVTALNYPIVHAYSNYGFELLSTYRNKGFLSVMNNSLGSFMHGLCDHLSPMMTSFLLVFPDLPLKGHPYLVLFLLHGLPIIFILLIGSVFILQLIKAIRQRNWSVGALYVFFYSVTIVLWNYEEQMNRFLVVILPWLWLYFLTPLLATSEQNQQGQSVQTSSKKLMAREVSLPKWLRYTILAIVLTSTLWTLPKGYGFLHTVRSNHWLDNGKYRATWSEYQQAFSYVKAHVPANAPIATEWDTVFYLYTGRPTFYTYFYSVQRENDGKVLPSSYHRLMESLDHYGVKYLVLEPEMVNHLITGPYNPVAANLLVLFPQRFKELYHTPIGMITLFEILPKNSKEKGLTLFSPGNAKP